MNFIVGFGLFVRFPNDYYFDDLVGFGLFTWLPWRCSKKFRFTDSVRLGLFELFLLNHPLNRKKLRWRWLKMLKHYLYNEEYRLVLAAIAKQLILTFSEVPLEKQWKRCWATKRIQYSNSRRQELKKTSPAQLEMNAISGVTPFLHFSITNVSITNII